MKRNLALIISSLSLILLFSLHLTQDFMHDQKGADVTGTIICLSILVVFLYGTLELGTRRVGYVIMMLGGLASLGMPFLHTLGPRAIRWGFDFVWVMIMEGTLGAFVAIVAAQELWKSFGSRDA